MTEQPTELVPIPMMSPEPVPDIKLQEGGVLAGQVLDTDGQPIANAPVTVQQDGQTVNSSATDQAGNFQVNGLRGGVYEVVTPACRQTCRCWPCQAAPPIARPGLRLKAWLGSPIISIAVAAGAIAIPLALDDDDAS